LDTYGTSEFSLVAWECREHSGYHINADSVLMEFLDGEEEIAAGERGAVVCTGLNNYAMPLIRYKDEDIAVPLHENCSCGVKLPMLKSIEGRESDMLMALDGRLISPWQFFPFPFDNYDGITQFRIIQDRKNRILFQMIIEEGVFAISRLDNARLRIKKLFGEEMQADFEITDQLKKDQTGKMRAISRLF
jgi:phenylacetate-CoA ligase